MSLPDPLAEVDRRYRARLTRAIEELRAAVEARARRAGDALVASLGEVRVELPADLVDEQELLSAFAASRPSEGEDALGTLHEAAVALDVAATQGEMLEAMLAGARRLAPRAALWLTREEGLVGWGSTGFAAEGDPGDPIAGREEAWGDAALADLAAGRGVVVAEGAAADAAARALGGGGAAQTAIVPLVLRDRVAAALFVARREGEPELAPPALKALALLSLLTAQRLELAAQSARPFTPTLYRASEVAQEGLALWSAQAIDAVAAVEPAATLAEPPSPPPSEGWSFAASAEPAVEVAPSGAPAPPAGIEELFAYEPMPLAEPEGGPADAAEAATWSAEAPAPPGGATWEMPAYEPARVFELEPELPTYEPAPEPVAAEPTAAPPIAGPWAEPPVAEEEAVASAPPAEAEASAWRMEPEPLEPEEDATVLAAPEAPAEPRGEVTSPHAIPFAAPPTPPVEGATTTEVAMPGPGPTIAFPQAGTAAPEEEDATVLMSRRPQPAAEPPSEEATRAIPIVRPVPVEEEVERTAARGPRTTEVAPPPDLQGPGLAFTMSRQQRASGESALHDEARRLARLLVSEIKLYNEEQVEEGRRHRDLYLRLREDIDRSRQIYEERVHDSVRGTTDYFQQELVRSLAGGDARALGI